MLQTKKTHSALPADALYSIIFCMRKKLALILILLTALTLTLAACVKDAPPDGGSAPPADDGNAGDDSADGEKAPYSVTVENGTAYIEAGSYFTAYAGDDMNGVLSNLVADGILSGSGGVYVYGQKEYASVTVPEAGAGKKLGCGRITVEGETLFFERKPLKWQVLSEDETGYYAVATEVIEYSVFNEAGSFSTTSGLLNNGKEANDYYASALCEWLNGDFFGEIFSEAEAGYVTSFTLMSVQEIYELGLALPDDGEFKGMVRAVRPTDYMLARGERVLTAESGYFSPWWLRDAGAYKAEARIVGAGGVFADERPVTVTESNGVRPLAYFRKAA